MALRDIFTFRKVPPVRRPTVPSGLATLHRSRVESLQNSWYNQHRGFLNSPNRDIQSNLMKSRELARLLVDIDGLASKYVELLGVYVVGATGMQITPQVHLPTGELDVFTNNIIQSSWESWCDNASVDGRFTFTELEHIGIRTVGRDGEALFRIYRNRSLNRFGFAIHPVDPTLLDVTYNARLANGHVVVMGVEFNGPKPVAYHIWNRYPDELTASGLPRERERVPEEDIIHIFDDPFGSLVRGMPWLQSAMPTLARLHDYKDAHLQACQIAAYVPLIWQRLENDSSTYDDVSVGDATYETPTNQSADLRLDYQQIVEVPAHTELKPLNLQYPQTGYKDAVESYTHDVACALMMSYASLTSDSSQENYSTVRFTSQQERDHWRTVQMWYSKSFHMKVYRRWLETAMLTDELKLTGVPEKYHKVKFQARGFANHDPLKDIKAYREGLAEGIYTRRQIVAEAGGDWDDNIKQLAAEQKFAESQGVALPALQTQVSLAQQVADLESATITETPK